MWSTRPLIYDARPGLTSPSLDALRRAQRLDLSPKDDRTTIIGCWVDELLHAIVISSQPSDVATTSAVITEVAPHRPYVRDRLAALRAGDLLTARWSADVVFLILERGELTLEFGLGKPPSQLYLPRWPLF
jgi:hypothetical protein